MHRVNPGCPRLLLPARSDHIEREHPLVWSKSVSQRVASQRPCVAETLSPLGATCRTAHRLGGHPAATYGVSAPSYLIIRPPLTRLLRSSIDCAWSILTSRRRYLTAMDSTEGEIKTDNRRGA